MQCLIVVAAFAALGTSLATPFSGALITRQDSVGSAPAECNFSDTDKFVETSNQGNNWCMRGYYAEGDIGCQDQSAGTGWTPPYYTQATHPYCTCHSVDADTQGRHPVSIGVWFKGANNPQEMEINTSNVPTDDGRCYSYQRSDGTVQSNAILSRWSLGGIQFACLWLNHTNVPEQVIGFSTKKYVGNPQCPYDQ
ncbi:hypothetical protein F4804DRAFT_164096 [Jackrogersella minutella]|nr:hypothetical protein F4804DRAFT_164096 [Jackrogersella minutella]